MIKFLKKLFGYERLTGRVIHMEQHRSWGDHIQWVDFAKPNHKVFGHMPNKPRVGDELRSKEKRFRFDSVKYESNPSDMFFADLSEITSDK